MIPPVQSGFTDCPHLRDMGIVCYGFSPIVNGPQELTGVHGNDKRVSVASVIRGAAILREVVEAAVF